MRSPSLLGAGLAAWIAFAQPSVASPWPSAVERIEQRLQKGNVAARRQAMRDAQSLPTPALRSVLELALNDEDLEVRLMAARTARALRVEGLSRRVLSWLKSREADERLEAVRLLAVRPDEEAIVGLSRLTGDSESAVRIEVAIGLGLVSSQYVSRSTPKLLALLDDAEPLVRLEAAASLGRLGQRGVAVPLSSHLQDSDARVRTQVALALGALGVPTVIPALLVGLSDPNADVVAAVARSLGALKALQATQGLSAVAERSGRTVESRAALEALVRLESTKAQRIVVRLLSSPSQRGALQAVAERMGRTLLPVTRECLRSQSGEVAAFCAQLHLSAEGAEDEVLGAFQEGKLSDEGVLELFSGTLQRRATVFALEMLSSPSVSRVRAGLKYLASVEELPAEAEGPIREALTHRATSEPLTLLVLRALGKVHSQSGEPDLAPFLQASSDEVRAAAARTQVLHGATGKQLEALLLRGGAPSRGALEGFARGANKTQAETLIGLLHGGQFGRRRALLSVLDSVPVGLAPASLTQLKELLDRTRGQERDALLVPLFRNLSPQEAVSLVETLDRADQRQVAQVAWFDEKLLSTARWLLRSEDPRTVQLALGAVGRWGGDSERVLAAKLATEKGASFIVQGAALRALTELARRGNKLGAKPLLDQFCSSEAPALRASALRYAEANGTSCPRQDLETMLHQEPDVRFRRLAAELLVARVQAQPEAQQTARAALRRCTFYERRREVARYCSFQELPVTPDSTEKGLLLDRRLLKTWSGKVAPETPLAISFGEHSVQHGAAPLPRMSDRGGHVLFPRSGAEVVDSTWSY